MMSWTSASNLDVFSELLMQHEDWKDLSRMAAELAPFSMRKAQT
jgi:hypothetical protein